MKHKIAVLCVDDNVNLCRILSFVLNHKGYSVSTAYDGKGALKKFRKNAFDVTFLDINMSGLNGVETLKRLKKLRPSAPVIMMTSYPVEEQVRESLAEGALDVLNKPLDMDDFLGRIESIARTKSEPNDFN